MRQCSIETVEKSYVDKLDAIKSLDLNLVRILPEFFINPFFYHSFHKLLCNIK